MLQEIAVTVAYFCESWSGMFTWQVGWRCWQILFCCFTHIQYTHSSMPACLSVWRPPAVFGLCVCELCGGIQINRCRVRGKRIYPFALAVLRSSSCIAISCFRPPLGWPPTEGERAEEHQRKETENWDRGWHAPDKSGCCPAFARQSVQASFPFCPETCISGLNVQWSCNCVGICAPVSSVEPRWFSFVSFCLWTVEFVAVFCQIWACLNKHP